MKERIATHYIVELIKCNPEKIKFVANVQQAMLLAAEKSGATIIDHAFHEFEPHGVSGFILISESHFSLHTWPENNYVALDIMTCSEKMDIRLAIQILKEAFSAEEAVTQELARGL